MGRKPEDCSGIVAPLLPLPNFEKSDSGLRHPLMAFSRLSFSKDTSTVRPRRASNPGGGTFMANPRRKLRDETGPDSAGQSGNTQQLRDSALADSQSVEELIEEGNAYEAGILSGVESAADADVAEVRTREVPEDDVPAEYLDNEP
jgi:hypothetical protein